MICSLINTDKFSKDLWKKKNSKVDLSVWVQNTKSIISHIEQINTQVAMFEEYLQPTSEDRKRFFNKQEFACFFSLTLSKKV